MKRTTLIFTSLIFVGGCAIRPAMISPESVRDIVESDKLRLAESGNVLEEAISLEDAIARALLNNRDKKLKALESALSHGQFELAKYDMLPELTASAGYSKRNNYAASASVTFEDGEPAALSDNPTYSVSQGKERTTHDAVFTWNILDFGLSYVRAKQNADVYLIARERERKVTHNITRDVRTAYWRAVSAERLLRKIGPMMDRTQEALEASQMIEAQQLQAPLQALHYQRELLDILRSLQSLNQELVNAKTELASLMGLKPGIQFQLKDVDDPGFEVPELGFELMAMEDMALTNRPELIESHYQKRISAAETRAALLKMLPGVNLTSGLYHDNSIYLLNQDWNSVGAQVSWNLMSVFRAGDERKIAQIREAMAEEQRLATSMAVLTQVHLSRMGFDESSKTYQLSREYLDVAHKIQTQVKNNTFTQSASELDLIREDLNALLAELRRDVAFADLQNSFGRIYATMGLDLVPMDYKTLELNVLSDSIQSRYNLWQTGALDASAPEAEAELSDDDEEGDTEFEEAFSDDQDDDDDEYWGDNSDDQEDE